MLNLAAVTNVLKELLVIAGGVVVSHGVASQGIWTSFSGFVIVLVAGCWGVWQHDLTKNAVLSVVRSLLSLICGILAGKGWITADQATLWTSVAVGAVPTIWAFIIHQWPGVASNTSSALILVSLTGLSGAKILALSGAAAVAMTLAACDPSESISASLATMQNWISEFNSGVQIALPDACAAIVTANAAFQTAASTGKIPAADVADESAAMAGVNALCANPSGVNVASTLQVIANTYAAIYVALNAQPKLAMKFARKVSLHGRHIDPSFKGARRDLSVMLGKPI